MTSPLRLVSVVENEETLRESVCRAIRLEDVRAEGYGDGSQAWEAFARVPPDLAILDTGVGGLDSSEITRRLRERSPKLPIVIIVAREDELDAVLASNPAADDYLSKPFSLKELLARVKLLLRRAALTGKEALNWEDRPLTLGPLTVDPLWLTVRWGERPVPLTVTEFLLLHSLVRRAGVVKTRDQLMQDAFPGRSAGDGAVDAHVARLRRKFEQLEPAFDAIEGVHGAGYRYRSGPSVKRS
jgi:two-component system response regulator ChvI